MKGHIVHARMMRSRAVEAASEHRGIKA